MVSEKSSASLFDIRLRKWVLLVASCMRLGIFSNQHCSSAVRNVYSGMFLNLLIRKITDRNYAHYIW
ncbi:hypothetical protein [Rubritalea tangerina]|uniref:hypothetical protein n=1 Tax=Rubritalea tangerina TaxID=430798 RepID=UPI00361CEFCF